MPGRALRTNYAQQGSGVRRGSGSAEQPAVQLPGSGREVGVLHARGFAPDEVLVLRDGDDALDPGEGVKPSGGAATEALLEWRWGQDALSLPPPDRGCALLELCGELTDVVRL
jgi:hypothetical protein